VRTSNSTEVELAACLTGLTSLTYLSVCGANVFAVETPAAAEALLGRLATLWIGTLRTRCASISIGEDERLGVRVRDHRQRRRRSAAWQECGLACCARSALVDTFI